MNIAFSTFIIFLLVIPGISFRSAYFFGPLTKKYSKTSAFDDFGWAIIPSIIIQGFGALFVNSVDAIPYLIKVDDLIRLLLGGATSTKVLDDIQKNFNQILYYNLTLSLFGALIGILLRIGIRRWHLDHRFSFLRFNNEWFYILRGETNFFHENLSKSQSSRVNRNLDTCTVNAVVKTDKGECYIYTGAIDLFYLTKDGGLDSIILRGANRRKFFDKIETDFYEIPTDIVVIKNSEIVTISVTLIDLSDILKQASKDAVSEIPTTKYKEFDDQISELDRAKNNLKDLENDLLNALNEKNILDSALSTKKLTESSARIQQSAAGISQKTIDEIKNWEQISEKVKIAEYEAQLAQKEVEDINKKIRAIEKKKLLAEAEIKKAEANLITATD